MTDSGAQSYYVEKFFHIPKSTFYRYLKIIVEHKMFENLHAHAIKDHPIPDVTITDTYTVKSMDGSDTIRTVN